MELKTYCKLCDSRHIAGQHELRDVKPRPWLREFLNGGPSSAPVAKPRTVSVATKDLSVAVCAVCDQRFTPQRKTARYCSEACRKAAFRAKRKAAV